VTTATCPLCSAPCRRDVVSARDWSLARCLACGLYYRNPPPAEKMRRHYENVYEDDLTSDHIDERRRAVFATFLETFAPRGGGRLLDIGCGSGEFLTLARERGWSVEGVEVSPGGAALARRRGLTVHASVEELPDDAYDVVTLWNVIDFFSHPLEQMRHIRRVLVPGGTTLVRAPNAVFQLTAWRLSRVVVWPAPLARLVRDAYFFQPLVWSPRTLHRLLQDAGFTEVQLWNSEVSWGDPYHAASPGREHLVAAVKYGLRALAQGVAVASRRRLLVGSSISAQALKA
jgi:2-polyprenyl-3-methyl-5-hydroxy-6-metoxy-1,4-benzoquinol methylase